MLSDQFIAELGFAIQAQHHILDEIKLAIAEIEESFSASSQKLSSVTRATHQLKELEALMDDLEANQDWIKEEDFGDFNPDQILNLYNKYQQSIFRELSQIGFKDWDSFVRQCYTQTLYRGIDPFTPYEAFLTEGDFEKLRSESYDTQYQWDKSDFIFVGVSGILACITDILLVQIPKNPNVIGNKNLLDQFNLTARFKAFDTRSEAGQTDWFSEWARHLSETCKVPYDATSYAGTKGVERIAGMYPKSHRFQSLGHDPVLGFVFGVLDIMKGTISGFSYEKLIHRHTWTQECVWSNLEPIGLIEALLRHIGHLISDVATPMGLPAPFMTLIQGINVGSIGEKNRTIGEVARLMYLDGYDFRHFLVSGITPAVIEIVLRAYIMLRHYSEHEEFKFDLASNPKYRSMLLMAHFIATLGNAGKITLMQGNPLAVNYAEWMAFVRYLVPSMKYWVFDEHRLRLEHMQQINSEGWNQLLQSSDQLLTTVSKVTSQHFALGVTKVL